MKYLSEKREIKETKTWLYRWVSINRNTMNKFCREWQTAHIKSFFLYINLQLCKWINAGLHYVKREAVAFVKKNRTNK